MVAVPSWARTTGRALRKRRKRLLSHGQLATMTVRNRFGRAAVVGEGDVIVSLTTHGARVQSVASTIESLARGSVKPRRMVLWLDDESVFMRLPDSLHRLQRRGLEVRLTENLGPHTKYYPALALALADGLPLVTADDDILYPRSWLAALLRSGQDHPDDVSCYRASVVVVDEDGTLAPYDRWPRCRTTRPSLAHFATGVSGVFYPVAMLEQLAARGTEFLRWCPRADDIWLHWTALRAGIEVRQVSDLPRHFPYVPGTQVETLMSLNVTAGGNDIRIGALYDGSDVRLLASARDSQLPGAPAG